MDYNYSQAKGEVKAGQTFASSINMGPSNPLFSSDLVRDEIVGTASTSQIDINLPWYPVRVSTFTMETADGTLTASADATGAITGVGIDTGLNSITAAGVLKFKLAGTVTTGADILVTYRFNNEDIRSDGPINAGFTNVPEVELKINSLPIEAHARTLRSYWALTEVAA